MKNIVEKVAKSWRQKTEMRINLLKHDCRLWQFISKTNDVCPFYYKWGNTYFFTFWGFRIVVGDFK